MSTRGNQGIFPSEPGPVLVLGAGASRPYGLPTAGELRQIILGSLKGNEALFQLGVPLERIVSFTLKTVALRKAGAAAELLLKADDWTHQIKSLPVAGLFLNAAFEKAGIDESTIRAYRDQFFKSQRVTIDAFVQQWPEFKQITQIAIAAVILLCERTRRLDGDWYQQLIEALLRNEEAFKQSGLDVITFNYDRSFDHTLFRALLSHCRDDLPTHSDWWSKCRIHHVYGKLGSTLGSVEDGGIPYGALQEFQSAAANLELVRGVEFDELPHDAFEAIRRATRIVLLGFGFWPENLDLLQLEMATEAELWGSAMGLPETIRMELNGRFPQMRLGSTDQDTLRFVLSNPVFAFPKPRRPSVRDYKLAD